jgi:hypothetical protein
MRQLGSERLEGTQVVLAQRGAELVDLALTLPDQVLVRSGQHLERLGQLGVRGDWPVQMAIGAHKIGEKLGVGCDRLPAGDATRSR